MGPEDADLRCNLRELREKANFLEKRDSRLMGVRDDGRAARSRSVKLESRGPIRRSKKEAEKESSDLPAFRELTEPVQQRRKLEKELEDLEVVESQWCQNLLASLKFDSFCEILAEFSGKELPAISDWRSLRTVECIEDALNVFKVQVNYYYNEPCTVEMPGKGILGILCSLEVQSAIDLILEGDVLYKFFSEKLLSSGLNSLSPDISKEILCFLKIVFCCVRAIRITNEPMTTNVEKRFHEILQVVQEFELPDVVLNDENGFSLQKDYYSHSEFVSKSIIYPNLFLRIF